MMASASQRMMFCVTEWWSRGWIDDIFLDDLKSVNSKTYCFKEISYRIVILKAQFDSHVFHISRSQVRMGGDELENKDNPNH